MGRGGFFLLVLVFFGTVYFASPARGDVPSANSIFGRYVGVFRNEKLKQEQVAKLDFAIARQDNNDLELVAVLTLHFGDFASGEYINYHFDNVRYNLLTRTLVFDQADQPVSLLTTRFVDGELVARMRANSAGNIGTLHLKKDRAAEPTQPLVEPLWGLYSGRCGTTETYLELATYRTTEDILPVGNPFGAYKVKGNLSWKSDVCLGGFCTLGRINEGSYNFFTGQLRLFGNRSLACSVKPGRLDCSNDCHFIRSLTKEAEKKQKIFLPPEAIAKFGSGPLSDDAPALEARPEEVTGEYVGYVHHAFLDRYQLASLNIQTFQVTSGGGGGTTLRMSAIANLYFGDRDSFEQLAYKFAERNYPNPLTAPQFILRRPESDVDAVLQIRSLKKGVIRGVWYSLIFGKVGEFELRKEGLPRLPGNAQVVKEVTGKYEGENFQLHVIIGQGKKAFPATENPFYPLFFGGLLFNEVIPGIAVTGGSYDFYTGKMGLETGSSVLAGERVSNKKLLLRPITPTHAPTWPWGDVLHPFIYRGPISE